MDSASPMSGRTIAHYRILERLGGGGMGVVYKAEDSRLGRFVALKFLGPELARDPQALERFRREARAASALDHPGICTIFDIGESDGEPYLVMEFMDGQPLSARIAGKPLSIDQILDVGIQVADALDAAHSAGILHRDIKPGNIFLTRRGQAKLLDFGLAKLAPEHPAAKDPTAVTIAGPITDAGTAVGTVSYMSPEQARGEPVDARSDLFSLGAVLYEMATGKVAFPGSTSAVIFDGILHKAPTAPVRLNPDVPEELERIINQALEKDRDMRCQSASELRAALKRLKRSTESGQTVATAAARPASRAKSWLAAVVAILVLTLAAAGWWFYRSRNAAIDSVAVLPFVNASNNADLEYLSDGITDGVIHSLSRLPTLHVMSRSSVFRYKGASVDPLKAAQELKVSAVLTGRMVLHGDTLTVSAELVDARDNHEIWGDRFERPSTQAAGLDDEIARAVASKLQPAASSAGISRGGTQDAEAYRLYLQGRYLWNKREPDALRKAESYFQQAIARDPGFALAYAGLADTYGVMPNWMDVDWRQTDAQAEAAARKAMELDPTLAEPHAMLASVYTDQWRWADSEREFKRALELEPNYASGHQWYGEFFDILGRPDDMLAEEKRALELDPFSLIINQQYAYALLSAGKFEEGTAQANRVLEMDPSFAGIRFILADYYASTGQMENAIEQYRELARLSKDPNAMKEFEEDVALYRRSGLGAVAQRDIARMREEEKRTGKHIPLGLARNYAILGDKDRMFQELNRAVDAHDIGLLHFRNAPFYRPYRSDPRFAEIIKRMGLPQ